MKKTILVVMSIAALLGLWLTKKLNEHQTSTEKPPATTAQSASYWTCPMHPQIHSEHPGECPICHMKLVQVKAAMAQAPENSEEQRNSVQATHDQMTLLGVQKTDVERMNLRLKIPVSGHFISASAVAFQAYESDLRYVKPGLGFSGVSSFYPDQEVTGNISAIDSIVDPTSRTVRVVGQIHRGPRNVLPETGFRGDIELTLNDRLAIPESSVLHTGSGDFVYVFQNENQLRPRKVALGLKTEGFYDVLAGLRAGESISSGANFLIDSESKIRAISEEPADTTSETPTKSSKPSCPQGQHWDIPMAMCMPGRK